MNARAIGTLAALLVACAGFAVLWWFVATDVRPLTAEPILTALSRLLFMLALPLRLMAHSVFGGVYMRHAHHMLLIIAFLTPIMWFLATWAMVRIYRHRKPILLARRHDAPRTSRRVFLSTVAAGTAGGIGGAFGADALLMAPQRVQVRAYRHQVPWLPDGMESLRIAHVSDTHLGPFVSRRFLAGVMAQVNEHNPDLVFLTGDYVHRHPSFIEDAIGLLTLLKPRLGSVAVLGNHDHWEGLDACRAAFARTAIPLIDNDRLFLTRHGLKRELPKGEGLCIAGVGDLWTDAVEFGIALRDVPEEMHRLVLSHNPDAAMLAAYGRVDLMLAGHTHGGQVVFPVIGAPVSVSRYGDRFIGGECEGRGFPVIVSRGLGLAGVPVRIGVPPEFGIVTLTRGAVA